MADLGRWVNRWLRHYEEVPEASSQRDALCARAEEVTQDLLRTAPDPLVWAHGDLHDKQILAVDGASAARAAGFRRHRPGRGRPRPGQSGRPSGAAVTRNNRMTPARFLDSPHAGTGRRGAAAGQSGQVPGLFRRRVAASGMFSAPRPLGPGPRRSRRTHRASARPPRSGVDCMSWHPPVAAAVPDTEGTQVAGPAGRGPKQPQGTTSWSFRRPGVQASGPPISGPESWSCLPEGADRRLPALAQVAPLRRGGGAPGPQAGRGQDRRPVISRSSGPGSPTKPPDRHTRMNALLGAGDFLTPQVLSYTPGCLLLTALPGRSLFELGKDPSASDAVFEGAWRKWSESWIRQQQLARCPRTPPGPRGAAAPDGRRRTGKPAAHRQFVAVACPGQPGGPGPAQRAYVRPPGRSDGSCSGSEPDPLGLVPRRPPRQADICRRSPMLPWGCWTSTRQAGPKLPPTSQTLPCTFSCACVKGRLTAGRYEAARRQVIAAAEELRVTPARFDAYAQATRLRLGCLYSFGPSGPPWPRISSIKQQTVKRRHSPPADQPPALHEVDRMTASAVTIPVNGWLELRGAGPLRKPARSPRRLLAIRARPARNFFGPVLPLMVAAL